MEQRGVKFRRENTHTHTHIFCSSPEKRRIPVRIKFLKFLYAEHFSALAVRPALGNVRQSKVPKSVKRRRRRTKGKLMLRNSLLQKTKSETTAKKKIHSAPQYKLNYIKVQSIDASPFLPHLPTLHHLAPPVFSPPSNGRLKSLKFAAAK